jgi:hypothetical protein
MDEFSVEKIKEGLERERPEFLASLYEGQPKNWSPNPRTADIYCLGAWLRRRLSEMPITPERQIQLVWYFNRILRAEDDLFSVAAHVMEIAVSGRELEPHYASYFKSRR